MALERLGELLISLAGELEGDAEAARGVGDVALYVLAPA
jgi:hypothetical protein